MFRLCLAGEMGSGISAATAGESARAWTAVGFVPGVVGCLAGERICGKAEFGEPGPREPRGAPCRVSAVTVLVSSWGVA